MKTQIILTVLLLSVIMLISPKVESRSDYRSSNGITVTYSPESSGSTINKIIELLSHKSISVYDVSQDSHALISEEESHLLCFHFNRVKRYKRYCGFLVVISKFMLTLVHILLLVHHVAV